MQLRFKCRVCGKSKLPAVSNSYQCFQHHACCCAEWLDMTRSLPELETDIFWRSDDFPKSGEKRYLKVQFPFCCETGETFRTLFQPAFSSVNGIGEPPEELEQSAVVTCQLDEVLLKNDFCAWISVTVQESILLSEIYLHYPAQIQPDLFKDYTSHNPHSIQLYPFTWKNWRYDCWTAQGDVGEWKLFCTDPSGTEHLLLLYEWGLCDEILYIGNIIKK